MTSGGAPKRAGLRASERGPLIVLAVSMALAAALILWLGRGTGFIYDEWYFWAGYHPVTLGNLLEPGNGNLNLIPVLLYKVVIAVMGVAYVPYRIVGALSVVAVSVLFFFATRAGDPRRSWLALGPAILLAFFGTARDAVETPLGIPTLFGLSFGLAAMITVERDTLRWDLVTFALLAAGLASFTTAVPFVVAVAVVMFLNGGRRRWRRLLVPATLLLAYAAYRWNYRDFPTIDGKELTLDHLLHAPDSMLNSAKSALASLVGIFPLRLVGEPPLIIVDIGLAVLVCAFAARLVVPPRLDRRAYAYAAGLLALWLSLAALDKEAAEWRYQYPGMVLLLGMLVELAAGIRLAKFFKVLAIAVLAFSLAVNVRQLFRERDVLTTNTERNEAKLAGLELIERQVPGSFHLQRLSNPEDVRYLDIYVIKARQYFSAVARDGSPAMSAAELARASQEQRAAADRMMFNGLQLPRRYYVWGVRDCRRAQRRGDSWLAATGPIRRDWGFGVRAGAAEVTARMRRYADVSTTYPLKFPPGASRWEEIPKDRSRVPWRASLTSAAPFELCAAPAAAHANSG